MAMPASARLYQVAAYTTCVALLDALTLANKTACLEQLTELVQLLARGDAPAVVAERGVTVQPGLGLVEGVVERSLACNDELEGYDRLLWTADLTITWPIS